MASYYSPGYPSGAATATPAPVPLSPPNGAVPFGHSYAQSGTQVTASPAAASYPRPAAPQFSSLTHSSFPPLDHPPDVQTNSQYPVTNGHPPVPSYAAPQQSFIGGPYAKKVGTTYPEVTRQTLEPSLVGASGHQMPQTQPHVYQQQQQQQQQYNGYAPPVQQQPPPHAYSNRVGGHQSYQNGVSEVSDRMAGLSVKQSLSQFTGRTSVNLMAEKNVRNRSPEAEASEEEESACCDKEVMRPTLTKVPETSSLLQKSRLPFGILLHPFKEDEDIPIIQDRTIVRCRSCRTYINPFVRLLDQRRWQCNLCNRVNDLPDDFLVDPHTKRFLDYPPRQPEIMYGSVEFVAPVEYMVRPPQPAAYMFVFDCSAHAYQLSYIPTLAKAILDNLDMIPGDSRTLIGFIAFDSKVHFFSFGDRQTTHFVMPDIQDVFLPFPDNLLVNLRSKRDVIELFLRELMPCFPANESDDAVHPVLDAGSALGPALAAAYRILAPIGGRITVFQAGLPTAGSVSEGSALVNREDPNNRTSGANLETLTPLLNPATDFFKKQALECSEHQVAVDLFSLNPSYSDLASVSQISKISGGSVFYYGNSSANLINSRQRVLARLEEDLARYLTRSIGFEAVLRLRCTRGLTIHSFHGNFFVRSTDLLTLPNVNPDSGYAVQIALSDDLRDFNGVCFQAAILYTNASGERRIRVHTLALPVVATVEDVISGADQEAVVGLLSKMAVDRSLAASITDAREAAINAVVDLLLVYKALHPAESCAGLVTSYNTRLLPLYVLALLKHPAFRVGVSTKVDERVAAMEKLKSLPLCHLITYIYPDLYPVHYDIDYANDAWPAPMQLTFANFERSGVYLMDAHDSLYLYICKSVSPRWLSDVFGVSHWNQIPDEGEDHSSKPAVLTDGVIPLPTYDNHTSIGLRSFIEFLIDSRPFRPHFFVLREDSSCRYSFLQYMHDDRSESAFSYYEFLQHLQQQMKT